MSSGRSWSDPVGMNTPEVLSLSEAEQPQPSAPSALASLGPAPTQRSAAAAAVMWAIIGAIASVGGGVAGVILSIVSAIGSSCSGMLCELENAAIAGLAGWGFGALFALFASVSNGGGTAVDKTARALSSILGVLAVPGYFLLQALV